MYVKYLVCALISGALVAAAGTRPYELEWAGRDADDHPALVDFESLAGWTVECRDATASFGRSDEQRIWGDYVGKVVYRGTGRNPSFLIKPPIPVRITNAFDAVSLWVYGNNFLGRDKSTPPVSIYACFKDGKGADFDVHLCAIRWQQWFLCHHRLSAAQMKLVRENGAAFCGLRVDGGRNIEDRTLYIDSLCVFSEEFKPLAFKPRGQRGVRIFQGRDYGINTGPGVLPFPDRKETIIPRAVNSAIPVVERKADILSFSAADTLQTEIDICSCQWNSLRMRIPGHEWIDVAVGGGFYFSAPDGKPAPPERAVLKSCEILDGKAFCRWDVTLADGRNAVVGTAWWMTGQSLVADISVEGGVVQEVRFGEITQLDNPKMVALPYYTYGSGTRPVIAVSGSADKPLFLMQHVDWTLSNASTPFAVNRQQDGRVVINGGVRYINKTDGRLNSCYERFVFCMAPSVEQVLPEIPNPVSPWKHVTGKGIWRAHGASNREADTAFWREMHRYGLRHLIVTDHETGWRDEHESFTFRTRAAPKKGGDKGQYDYARIMQDELGFVYGPYNNFTDFAPVNEFWNVDMVSRLPDNQLQQAWARCYAPKPLRAVEYCEKLAPMIEEKFHFSTAYCDVHTAVTPWSRVDYDWRVPGAGTFAQTYYAFGEIMLLQKKAWGGPVYSEGNNHFPYCGLTDGNYAQDQNYNLNDNPWVVDFDLLRMHDLCCNFGVGNVDMFFGRESDLGGSKSEVRSSLDRFLAATLAFGHPGFLLRIGGMENTLRSYYMLQQIQERYTQVSARKILYCDGSKLVDSSTALIEDSFRRSQVVVEYDGGVNVAANGNKFEDMSLRWKDREITLPPNGYAAWTDDGRVEVFSGNCNGRRADYACTPDYMYVDGRGSFARFERAASSGSAVCRFLDERTCEVIPVDNCECGFAICAESAVALDKAGNEIGPAAVRVSRGLAYVQPVKGAFSYRVKGSRGVPGESLVVSPESRVFAGDSVTVVAGGAERKIAIPRESAPGDRIWREFEGGWIDFTVVPLCLIEAEVSGNKLCLRLEPNAVERELAVNFNGTSVDVSSLPDGRKAVEFPLEVSGEEQLKLFAVDIAAGTLHQRERYALASVKGFRRLQTLPAIFRSGMCLRKTGKDEACRAETGARVSIYAEMTSGGVAKNQVLFMHPPYKEGDGYSYAEFDSVSISQQASAFRASVGKGDGSDLGDGIFYRLVVCEQSGKETVAASVHVDGHKWLPLEADLTRWAGQCVKLRLVTDPGENTSGDWGGWAGMRIESREQEIIWELLPPYRSTLKSSPHPMPGLTVDALRHARKGVVRYAGIGLAGADSEYGTFALLNGLKIGNMKPAPGNERENVWSPVVEIPLSREALESLTIYNVFEIFNPGGDCFKLRDFCLEVELADGRRTATLVNAGIVSQPGTWLYAEGRGVPQGENIRIDLWFSSEKFEEL